ncbi:uncharacterized protein VTP21DRAFT_8430 [Calcarisporiella thermophila]|uniref:uncharacterized protein n=1 Tax=Calcarisporiella thermophila TaxID=911321 RepID=UPI0037426537
MFSTKPAWSTVSRRAYEVPEVLKRARRPYRTRNVITGLALLGFCTAVYSYSFLAVKQDDFSDVVVPQKDTEGSD